MRPLPSCAILALLMACPLASGQAPARAPKVERFRLDNGLTVLLRPIKGTKDVALVVLYALGEDHDPKGKSGLGHMVEHLYATAAAGGTKARTINDIILRYPKGWNFQTGERYTVLATVFGRADLPRELKDAAARMTDLRITEDDLKRERPRVLEEVDNMFGGIPSLGAQNHARELVRPAPFGGRKGGAPGDVLGLTLPELQARWRDYYKPRNAVVVLAGDVEPVADRKAITELFGKLPTGKEPPPAHAPGPPKFSQVREVTVKSRLAAGAPEVCLAYPAPAPGSDLYAPFLVLVARMQARAGELEAGRGRFPVTYRPLDDPSAVYVAAPARKGEKAKDAVARLTAFVAKTAAEKFTPAEATRAVNTFGPLLDFGDLAELFAQNNPYGEAFSLGRRQQQGLDAGQLEKALRAVTAEDVRRAARELFAEGRWAAAVVTPRKE
jgi:zinc protease